MSAAIVQQINLYQPIFRQERKLFSAQTVAMGLALVLATLVVLWLFASSKVQRLEAQIGAVREQQRVQEQMAGAAGALRAQRANPVDARARIQKLSSELADRTRARDLLRGGVAGRTTGFASRLEGLAQQHTDGLWLDRILLSGDVSAMSLEGGTMNPSLVPRYLQALASEPALNGARFDQFVIERPRAEEAKPGVRFRAGSAALNEAAAAGKERS